MNRDGLNFVNENLGLRYLLTMTKNKISANCLLPLSNPAIFQPFCTFAVIAIVFLNVFIVIFPGCSKALNIVIPYKTQIFNLQLLKYSAIMQQFDKKYYAMFSKKILHFYFVRKFANKQIQT